MSGSVPISAFLPASIEAIEIIAALYAATAATLLLLGREVAPARRPFRPPRGRGRRPLRAPKKLS